MKPTLRKLLRTFLRPFRKLHLVAVPKTDSPTQSAPKHDPNDVRQSPIGFFNLGLSYLEAADELTAKQLDTDDPFRLAFEAPIRHLYAHAWELFLKACVFRQGMKPSEMKRKIGHSLTKAWDAVDKARFGILDLNPKTRIVPEVLDQFHMPPRMYAYPITGSRREFSLAYLRAASQRFRIPRAEILKVFR